MQAPVNAVLAVNSAFDCAHHSEGGYPVRKMRTGGLVMAGVGKSEKSWQKHELVDFIASASLAVGHMKNKGPGIFIDMHAGDAEGVAQPQTDLFREDRSHPTAAIGERLAAEHGLRLLLCERVKKHQLHLAEKFPRATVIGAHSGAYDHVSKLAYIPGWGFCVSDPNGPGEQGVEDMARIGGLISRMDFGVVFAQKSLTGCVSFRDKHIDRLADAPSSIWGRCARFADRNRWMVGDGLDRWGKPMPSLEWLERLNRKYMAKTPLIRGSPRFHYRVLLISNFIPDAIKRSSRFQVITNANHPTRSASLASQESATRSA